MPCSACQSPSAARRRYRGRHSKRFGKLATTRRAAAMSESDEKAMDGDFGWIAVGTLLLSPSVRNGIGGARLSPGCAARREKAAACFPPGSHVVLFGTPLIKRRNRAVSGHSPGEAAGGSG